MKWPFQSSDEQMMWRVQTAADAGAFAELMRRWQVPVQRLCARMTGDLHRAEDLCQDAFVRVFAHRAEFDGGSRFSTWLWRIALNLCHDEMRRRQRRGEVGFEPESGPGGSDSPTPEEPVARCGTPAESLEALERAEAVRKAVSALPEHYRSVVILRHYEGLRFSEIAEVLGIPEGTAKSRMAEALSILGSRLRLGVE